MYFRINLVVRLLKHSWSMLWNSVYSVYKSIRWNHSEDSVAVLAAAAVGTAEEERLEKQAEETKK